MARTLQPGAVILLCILLGVAAVTAGTAPVAAQDDDVPSLPALYYGDLTIADGSIDTPVVVDVVADGTIQASMTVDSDGSIGGPAASDPKLEVQEPNETDIEFQIGGTPITIESVDGESVNAESIPFASGVQEVELEAQAADIEPAVDLAITDAPETVDVGESVSVDIAAENTGGVAVDQDVELVGSNGDVIDTTPIDLDVRESTTATLTWEPTEGDAGNNTLTVQTGETNVTHSIAVERVSPPVVAQPSPGGSTDSDDTESDLPDGVAGSDEQDIDNSEQFGLSQVRFTNTTVVESITWETTELNGTVTATTYTTPPDNVSAAPGAMISLSEVSGSTINDTDPSTIQLTVKTSQLAELNASTDELRIFHFVDGEWTSLETTVVESDNADEVIVQGDPESLSYFAVSAVSEPTAEFSITPAEPDTETAVTVDASSSTTAYGELIGYEWSIDGTAASGETVETSFTDSGTVEIELTVENDAGETDTTTQSVSIASVSDDTENNSSDDNGSESTDDAGTTDDGIPGFTSLTALLALLVSIVGIRYRTRE